MMMKALLKFRPALWFKPGGRETQATAAIYRALVTGARAEWLYAEAGIPDTMTGRFDSLVLHFFILLQALKGRREDTADMVQDLFDHMFVDMDRTLREVGVGDLSVGKKIKKMIEAYYGRMAAYTAALAGDAAGQETRLADMLRRNLYGDVEPTPEQLARVARYVRDAIAHLAAQPTAALVAGAFTLPSG